MGSVFLRGEFAMEPGFGEALFAADGGDGDAEGAGGFVDTEAAEEAEFDDLGFAGIDLFELGECVAKCDDFGAFLRGEADGVLDGDGVGAGAAFLAEVAAGVVDEDLAHETGGDAIEVGAGFPIRLAGAGETEPGFMNEGGGLEGFGGAFAGEVTAGEAAQLLIDEGREHRLRVAAAILPFNEQTSDGILAGHPVGSPSGCHEKSLMANSHNAKG